MEKEKENAVVAVAAADKEKRRAQELQKSYQEIQAKTSELERFKRITMNREMDMLKLKSEINALLQRLGEPRRYRASGEGPSNKPKTS
jgi:predicted  nucleic acid-binding Zn-ribbon protein